MARVWTAEQRAKQSEAIQRWKPWTSSTGPRTDDGKAKVARNPYKGNIRRLLRDASAMLKAQKATLKEIDF